MKRLALSLAAVPLLVGGFSSVSASENGINILSDLKLDGEIRPRYEFVDDGNSATANANAITARTKLKVTGGLFEVDGLSASVGIISVNNFGSHQYNWSVDKTNTPPTFTPGYTDGTKPYAIVVDPQYAMISNAEVNYKINKTLLHAGRGQVNLDNQRFIGTVGWRQLERSYDTVFVADNSVENLSLLAAWVYGLQGVGAGPTTDTNSILLHAAYTVMPELKVTVYDYMLASIHDTYGIALTGKVDAGAAKVSYRAEYAVQKDASMKIHGTDSKADANYMNLDVTANISGVIVGANYEYLSGQNATGSETEFTTPLATGHKFNGWADKFLTTPDGGLIDMNAKIGYKAKGFGKVLAVYHQFTADTKVDDGVNDDLGSEIDFLYANKVPGVNNLSLLLKGALYSGGKVAGYTNDTTKYWVQLDYKFSIK